MRKSLLALLVLALLLVSISPVAASQSQPSPPQPGFRAVLSSPDTDRQVILQGKVRPATAAEALLLPEGQDLAVYTVEVTAGQLATVYNKKTKWDSTLSVLVTMYMYFNEIDDADGHWVSIDRYTSMWRVYVSGVSMSNARIRAGCFAYESRDGPPEECDPLASTQTSYFTPSNGVTYVLSPYWRGHYQQIVDISFQAGTSRVTLKRGTSTWTLSTCVYEGTCGNF